MNEVKKLRAALARHRQGRRGNYPPELRAQAVTWAQAARRRGETQAAIVEQLGPKWETLARWASGESSGKQHQERPKVQPLPVQVSVPEPEPVQPPCTVFVAPSGHRVEGLTVGQVAELLGLLS